MKLTEAQKLIREQVEGNLTHQDYKTVTELAEKNKILMTGTNMAKLLRRVASKEDPVAFIQRCTITKAITPAVAASIRVPFYKVARNQRIRSVVDVKDPAKNEQIQIMIKKFYGSSKRKTKGLDYWLKSRFMALTFTDPNAWVVVEWDAPESAADVIQARPFEVSSKQARNFKVINEEVYWLYTQFDIKVNTLEGGNVIKKAGIKHTLYEKDYTIVWENVNKEYLDSVGFAPGKNQQYITDPKTNQVVYLETVNEPKLKFVPAFRIGYFGDLDTDGRTYVNPYHDGMCFFDKSIKTVSEFDLTMTNHVFPQKIQYAPVCKGPSREKKCNGGYTMDGQVCPACSGTGFGGGHKTSQDVITLPMPEKGTPNNEIIDLTKLVAYVTPSMELVKFQNEYTQQLKSEVHQAVFNSQVFVKKTNNGSGESGQPMQTATENDNNMQSVYDALEPFTEKFSDIWKDIVGVIAMLANVEDLENADIDHVFPADFKLKTADVLLAELKTINESGAPSFMKDSITADLADIIFAGDQLGLLKVRIKRRFFPFNGKNPDEIAVLLSSPEVPRRSKILYSNFELIFIDIEEEVPDYWTTQDRKKQRAILDAKIEEYKKLIEADAPKMDLNTFRNNLLGGPGGREQNNGGDNNGNPDDQNPDDEENTEK